MEIENHMNRRDLGIPPPAGLNKRELNDYYVMVIKANFGLHKTLQGAALKTEIPNT